MKLNEIRDNKGATHSKKIVGRGIGSGLGKTSGKGHKGQKARGTGKVRLGFEGGQNPIYRRMPKRGFNNIFAKEYFIINLADISKLIENGKIESSTVISYETLKEKAVIKGSYDGLKILGKGEVSQPLSCKVSAISKSALDMIKSKGGNVEVLVEKKFISKRKEDSK
ncbi:MAG: 50S ribosomal protein L15 [Alphaproteobacteria bacterium]|jgi:large subunit ribosomal protein L15|nr:50S ribosomal protein L15 [Alphaproteobacteria bacterium]